MCRYLGGEEEEANLFGQNEKKLFSLSRSSFQHARAERSSGGILAALARKPDPHMLKYLLRIYSLLGREKGCFNRGGGEDKKKNNFWDALLFPRWVCVSEFSKNGNKSPGHLNSEDSSFIFMWGSECCSDSFFSRQKNLWRRQLGWKIGHGLTDTSLDWDATKEKEKNRSDILSFSTYVTSEKVFLFRKRSSCIIPYFFCGFCMDLGWSSNTQYTVTHNPVRLNSPLDLTVAEASGRKVMNACCGFPNENKIRKRIFEPEGRGTFPAHDRAYLSPFFPGSFAMFVYAGKGDHFHPLWLGKMPNFRLTLCAKKHCPLLFCIGKIKSNTGQKIFDIPYYLSPVQISKLCKSKQLPLNFLKKDLFALFYAESIFGRGQLQYTTLCARVFLRKAGGWSEEEGEVCSCL